MERKTAQVGQASGILSVILTASNANDTVWVAVGIYKPTTGSNKELYFRVFSGVKVFGGFVGNEPANYDLKQRKPQQNPTILSGDITNSPTVFVNDSRHVVTMNNVSPSTTLDGFIIERGNANGLGSGVDGFGGGLLITGNTGSSIPTIDKCVFRNNRATFGGAIFNHGAAGTNASPTIQNCVFYDNLSTEQGGAIYNDGGTAGASPIIRFCTFYGNHANTKGGAIGTNATNSNPSPTGIANSIFWGNTATGGDPFFHIRGNAKITIVTSLVDATTCANLSNVTTSAFFCSSMIFNQNPLFVDATNGDLRLKVGSGVIDQGSSIAGIDYDAAGYPRNINGTVDMGAYEFQAQMYVKHNAIGINNGATWTNAFTDLQNALKGATQGSKYGWQKARTNPLLPQTGPSLSKSPIA